MYSGGSYFGTYAPGAATSTNVALEPSVIQVQVTELGVVQWVTLTPEILRLKKDSVHGRMKLDYLKTRTGISPAAAIIEVLDGSAVPLNVLDTDPASLQPLDSDAANLHALDTWPASLEVLDSGAIDLEVYDEKVD